MLPLYEAKMIHHYDTRWATYTEDGKVRDVTPEEKRDPDFYVMPRYWVHEDEVEKKLEGKWDKSWLLGWRDITNNTNERTAIAAQLPRVAFGDPVLLGLPNVSHDLGSTLQSIWSSFPFDFCTRQKVGGTHLKLFTFVQLPVLNVASVAPWAQWISQRVDRLNAQRLPPEDAAILRAELDALMFHLYGVSREDADYIMETFPIVKRKDEAEHGEYRTKRLILEKYDELQRTMFS